MSMRLDKAPFSGVKLLLITKLVPLKGNSITFSKQGCFHTDTPHQTPPPLLSGSPEPARPADGGMRRDKPMVGLHQHMRLAKASRVTDRHSSGGSVGVGAGRDGAAQTREAANLPPASLLMPTICVCNSSPTGQEPPQAHTQVNKHPERAI